jgi:two-component system, oxyanion-binding sensor
VFRPDLHDAALGRSSVAGASESAGRIEAFAGPSFDPGDIRTYLAAFGRPDRANG